MVLLKCQLGNDCRKIRLEDSLSYSNLTKDVLPTIFEEDMSHFHITYTDKDDDICRITSEEELREALYLYPDNLSITMQSTFPVHIARHLTFLHSTMKGDLE
jgi:hypothetical protein